MNEKLNVRALKGAPLSIVIVLMLQRRSVSHSLLCQETGYSDRTVTQALEYLTSNQIVTRAGHSGFQLTGENYQLPLYWDEKTEPADPSPALSAPETSLPEAASENFSEKITILEKEIESLKSRVTELENRKNYDSEPEIIVNSTAEIVNSTPLVKQTSNKDIDKEINQDCLIDSELLEILDEYRRLGHGLIYSENQLRELCELRPVPAVLEFVLPRAGDFETARKWCSWDVRKVKYNLLKRFGISMPALQRITDNPDISPWLIDYHYWAWYLGANKDQTLGFVVYKIEKGVDRLKAESIDPLQYRYL